MAAWGPLMDTVYNKGYSTTIILDNRITGMTGLQEHPGTGYTLKGEPANMVDYEQFVRALALNTSGRSIPTTSRKPWRPSRKR